MYETEVHSVNEIENACYFMCDVTVCDNVHSRILPLTEIGWCRNVTLENSLTLSVVVNQWE